MFPNNPSIVPIKFSEDTVVDNNINFNIKLLRLLAKKPTSAPECFSPLITKETQQAKKNPFVEPFEPGQLIDSVTETHRLIFNKFSVCERHVIVITKEFER